MVEPYDKKKLFMDRMKRNRLLILISLFSLKIDFNYSLLILRFDFWCVATVGRHSWQAGERSEKCRERCREKIEIALSKIAKLP